MENDTFDVYDDTTAGTEVVEEYKESFQNSQIVYYIEEEKEVDREQFLDMGIFKTLVVEM